MGCAALCSDGPRCAACAAVHSSDAERDLCRFASSPGQLELRLGPSHSAVEFGRSRGLPQLLLPFWTGHDVLTLGMLCKTNRRFLWAHGCTPLGRLHRALHRRHLSALPGILRTHAAQLVGAFLLAAVTSGDDRAPPLVSWNDDIDIVVPSSHSLNPILHEIQDAVLRSTAAEKRAIGREEAAQSVVVNWSSREPAWWGGKLQVARGSQTLVVMNVFVPGPCGTTTYRPLLNCLLNTYNGVVLHVIDREAALHRLFRWFPGASGTAEDAWTAILLYRSRGFRIVNATSINDVERQIREWRQYLHDEAKRLEEERKRLEEHHLQLMLMTN